MILTKPMYAALILATTSAGASTSKVDLKPQDVQSLRAEGPDGLEKFLLAYAEPLAGGDRYAREALDTICAQRDCYTTKLYWYTDLEAAKARARAEHKPILSLHLLGRLDEELSCANSRYFRKLLYPDNRISALLRKTYVLHWKTVRPVPKVTIDFGDGRVLKRTVTGNSIHYVLDSEGRPIDAIPGLLTPETFLASLTAAEDLARELSSLPLTERESALKRWHYKRMEQIAVAWETDIRRIDPRAKFQKTDLYTRIAELEKASEQRWANLGRLHGARLSREVESLIVGRGPTALAAGRLALTKSLPEVPLLRQLEFALAEDSIRNEYQLHRQIHDWLSRQQHIDVEALNRRVYANLFLTPLDDPWYGLKPAFAYAAIDDT